MSDLLIKYVCVLIRNALACLDPIVTDKMTVGSVASLDSVGNK